MICKIINSDFAQISQHFWNSTPDCRAQIVYQYYPEFNRLLSDNDFAVNDENVVKMFSYLSSQSTIFMGLDEKKIVDGVTLTLILCIHTAFNLCGQSLSALHNIGRGISEYRGLTYCSLPSTRPPMLLEIE